MITYLLFILALKPLAFFELSILMDLLNIYMQRAGLVRQEVAKLKEENVS
jgi:hypothetical protein